MTIPLDRAALLVIGVQVDYCAPWGKLARAGRNASLMDAMIDQVTALAARAEAAGAPVWYTQMVHDLEAMTPLQRRRWAGADRPVLCDPTDGGSEFYRLQPPRDRVIRKTTFDPFASSDLHQRLRGSGIETVVLTGADTMYCVESAARTAFDLGYRVVVPREAVAGNANLIAWHEHTLAIVDRTFGEVVAAADLWQP